GRGIEGIITDAIAGRITDLMVPALQQEQYGPALALGARAIAATVAKGFGVSDSALVNADPFRGGSGGEAESPFAGILVVIVIIVVLTIIAQNSRGGRGGRGGRRPRYGGTSIGWGGGGGSWGGGLGWRGRLRWRWWRRVRGIRGRGRVQRRRRRKELLDDAGTASPRPVPRRL
ncbi:MAG: TPM domain-containing protein, partial [Gemmatimonadetes bacterium]|nr:TPM domain-containing protein [Gemmatimonadota bacterium]